MIALVGCLVRTLLFPLLGPDTPILISIIAVALSAWLYGFGPGILATSVSLVGALVLLAPTLGHSSLLTLTQILRLLLFLMTGLIVSGLTEAWNRSIADRQRAEQEQENRILQERNRIARDIHDTLAQGLTGIIIQLEAAEDTLTEPRDDASKHVARARELARQCLSEARRSVLALRPELLESQDLAGALRRSAEQMTSGTGIVASVETSGIPPSFFAGEVEVSLLRIAMEALTNALKHARANKVQITLTYEETQVTMSIKDNGRGFTPHSSQARSGFGLTGMWERAERIGAQFTLVSFPGQGTEVRVTVHLSAPSLPV